MTTSDRQARTQLEVARIKVELVIDTLTRFKQEMFYILGDIKYCTDQLAASIRITKAAEAKAKKSARAGLAAWATPAARPSLKRRAKQGG